MVRIRQTGFCLIVSCVFLLSLIAFSPLRANCANNNVWYVYDIINPSIGQVQWSEEGGIDTPASWIASGEWSYASLRESLVGENDIFVSTYEQINWTRVRGSAEYYYDKSFNSFYDFDKALKNEPSLWLDMSWEIDTQWYGVNPNTTKVKTSFDENNNSFEIWTWFHITRVPEYLVGEGKMENWLTGFDLTSVSIGNLELWEFYQDWGTFGTYYTLRFEAPANLLSEHNGNYTFQIGVSPDYRGYTFDIQQVIDINMPANTEILDTSPSSLTVNETNIASFIIAPGDTYPQNYIALSGPSPKTFTQIVAEIANVWFTTPAGWAAIVSILVLTATAFRGRILWRRNKLYHRLYKSMVTVYDLYANQKVKFQEEMGKISSTVFKMLVEDRITDEQFEKLLKRRDDLLERSNKLQPPQ